MNVKNGLTKRLGKKLPTLVSFISNILRPIPKTINPPTATKSFRYSGDVRKVNAPAKSVIAPCTTRYSYSRYHHAESICRR